MIYSQCLLRKKMGRRKRLLREKRKAKHQKMALRGLQYRIKLGIKEYFRMKNIADTYLKRLTKATLKKEPLPMAIIAYQAFRDSDTARLSKVINKKNYDAAALDSINRMAEILVKLGWEDDGVKEFLVKSKELAGLE